MKLILQVNPILQSIKPIWVAKILNGDKTIEVRTTAPKDWLDYLSGKTKVKPEPRTVYIYCTKGKNNALISFEEYKGSETFTSYDCICGKFKSEVMRTHGYDDVLDGKVIAKYTLREVEKILWNPQNSYTTATLAYKELERASQLNLVDLHMYARRYKETETDYLGKKAIVLEPFDRRIFAYHISDLEIFDEPRELGEFGLERAPQSWAYIRED